MKIGLLRKIYPLISNHSKNIKWRSLTEEELDISMHERQHVANCFDEATRYSLLNSAQGRDLIKKRIKIERGKKLDPAYKTTFDVNGNTETYRATTKDYFGKYYGIYRDFKGTNDLFAANYPEQLSLGVSVGISKLVGKHPTQKPIISRLYLWPFFANRRCEFNKPSNAFKWFTGINPTIIGESGINQTLKPHRDNVLKTLGELGELSNKDYSFVALSGHKKIHGIPNWHCLPIIDINGKNKTVTILNKRTNKKVVMSFDRVAESFKALVGINWKNQAKV